jgi:hypothetical protein
MNATAGLLSMKARKRSSLSRSTSSVRRRSATSADNSAVRAATICSRRAICAFASAVMSHLWQSACASCSTSMLSNGFFSTTMLCGAIARLAMSCHE